MLAMMALTVPDAQRGAASGWQTAGNLAGTAVGGALVTWMITHLSPATTAIALAAICALAAIPAAFVDETHLAAAERGPPHRRPARRRSGAHSAPARAGPGWSSVCRPSAPARSRTCSARWRGTTRPTTPRPSTLSWWSPACSGGSSTSPARSSAGVLADRMNRRLAYALCGGLTASAPSAMLLGPASPRAFTVGCLAYQFANGLCYAVFYAFVLELVGKRRGRDDAARALRRRVQPRRVVRDLVRRLRLRPRFEASPPGGRRPGAPGCSAWTPWRPSSASACSGR